MPRYQNVWPIEKFEITALNLAVRIDAIIREPGGQLRWVRKTIDVQEALKLVAALVAAIANALAIKHAKGTFEFKDHPKVGDSIPGDPAATIEAILRL
jgi:hypothetical protein